LMALTGPLRMSRRPGGSLSRCDPQLHRRGGSGSRGMAPRQAPARENRGWPCEGAWPGRPPRSTRARYSKLP
jgi:hypothetical protein